jgi:F0F1-type ATP synthase assembly protein I
MKKDQKNFEAPWWQPSLILFGRLSGWIAVPVVIGVFLGKFLDKKFGTDPWFFLISVGVAFVFSTFGIIRDSLIELNRIEREEKEKKENLEIKKD